MAVRKKTDQTDPFCRVVTVTVLPVHLQAKHILFSDQVCFLAAPDLYFAFQHRNVCSCLFPLTAAGIFCPRFHINPVNLCHTVIFIRKTVPYFIFAPYLLRFSDGLCRRSIISYIRPLLPLSAPFLLYAPVWTLETHPLSTPEIQCEVRR